MAKAERLLAEELRGVPRAGTKKCGAALAGLVRPMGATDPRAALADSRGPGLTSGGPLALSGGEISNQ